MSKTKKVSKKENGRQPMKTLKTTSKKNSSKSGLSVKQQFDSLITSISMAKGMCAVLLSKHQSLSTKPLTKTQIQNLEILSRETLNYIWEAEETAGQIFQKLSKSYKGICLH